MARRLSILLALPVLVIACGGTTEGPTSDAGTSDAAHADGATGTDGGGDATLDADTTPHETDGGACPTSLDAFKPCTMPSDCIAVVVPACCGVPMHIGIAKSAAADYDSCNPSPDCAGLGCAGSSDCKAEDGNTASGQFGPCPIQATCTAGLCTSFVEADGGDAGSDGG